MTHKWLKEAQSNIVDEILWGNSYHGHDITKVIDGEPVDTFFRLYVSRRKDDADKWLEELVTLYVQRHEELMEFYRMDEEERMRESAIDAERERRYLVAEAI